MPYTNFQNLPYPAPTDPVNVPGDIQALAEAIDTKMLDKAVINAKGDLIVGLADNTIARLGVGTNGYALVADSAEVLGVKWGQLGLWQSYTPSWTQSATITKTVDFARYTQIGKLVMGSVKMTATSAGTSNTRVVVGLPVTASSSNFVMGSMVFYKSGTSDPYGYQVSIPVLYESSTTVAFGFASINRTSPAPVIGSDARFGQSTTYGGAGVTGLTLGAGDSIFIQFQYEAA